MSPFTLWLTRQWRLLHPGRGSVARPSDRIEGAVLAVALVTALIAVPVAGIVVSTVYADQMAVSRQQTAERHEVSALVLTDAPPALPDDHSSAAQAETVTATWRLADGSDRTGPITVGAGTTAGTHVPIWVDPAGSAVPAPQTAAGAMSFALGLGLLVWCGVVVALAALVALVHRGLDRLRLTAWDREWARHGRKPTRW